MHRIFQTYIDHLSESTDVTALRESMVEATQALELSCFAYLCLSAREGGAPQLISTYPSTWTAQYLQNRYERFDPVITQALEDTEPFQWGLNSRASILSRPQQELFEDAARFGIACGFTVPIHDGRGPIAAVTFAADEHRGAAFSRRVVIAPRIRMPRMGGAGQICLGDRAHSRHYTSHGRLPLGKRQSEARRALDLPSRRPANRFKVNNG